MPLFGPNRDRLDLDQAQALNHQIRLRIVEMHECNPGRLLSVKSLTADLRSTPGYEHVQARDVNYHRARLIDADLLPVE